MTQHWQAPLKNCARLLHPADGKSAAGAGLSPLTRGTLLKEHLGAFNNRFIPAHAGNTGPRRNDAARLPVYPRSRGEHCSSIKKLLASCGLSPLTRGTLHCNKAHSDQCRFIPAHAGNTSAFFCASASSAVYPRSRGEHHFQPHHSNSTRGLSPLTRGTLMIPQIFGMRGRFIPAHAGNTNMISGFLCGSPVYPRSRGEHAGFSVDGTTFKGLSPLTRGTLIKTLRLFGHRRFIPAHAGNTSASPARNTRRAVYPRSRGEHGMHAGERGREPGLSPLTRGTLPEPFR